MTNATPFPKYDIVLSYDAPSDEGAVAAESGDWGREIICLSLRLRLAPGPPPSSEGGFWCLRFPVIEIHRQPVPVVQGQSKDGAIKPGMGVVPAHQLFDLPEQPGVLFPPQRLRQALVEEYGAGDVNFIFPLSGEPVISRYVPDSTWQRVC